MRMQCKTRQS